MFLKIVPHYYVQIPLIEDPQHSYHLCSQKLSTTLLCSDAPIQDPQIEKIRVALNCYQVLFTY